MKVLCVFSAAAVLACAGSATAEPVTLSDAELADIAAGYYATPASTRDAVIVGDDTDADIHATSSVALDADVQRRAKAAALVNGVQSTVANASNVWDRRGAGGASAAQVNRIRQEGSAAAYLKDAQLQGANVKTRETEIFDSSFTGGIVPQEFTFTGAVTTKSTTTDSEGNKTTNPTQTSNRSETLKIGRGVAMADEVDVASAAGTIAFSEAVHADSTTTVSASYTWSGFSITVTVDGSATVHSVTDGGISGAVDLPPYALHAKGVICQALIGSCSPYEGFYNNATQTQETRVNPARVQDASAGRIVLSGGELHKDTNSNVTLEDRAQRDIAALHAVNAAGSQVANGLNVSAGVAAIALPRTMELRQYNQVNQRQ